jgi:ABC-type amino acid transport substrate-binding protein
MNRVLRMVFSSMSGVLVMFSLFMQSISDSAFAAPVIIRVDQDSFPATYMREGQWQGMDIEFIQSLMARAGLDYSFIQMPFPRSLLQMQEGQIQMIPNLVRNDARSAYMYWLGPNRVTCIGLVVQQKFLNLEIHSTDDLIRVAGEQKKAIGYLIGASYSPYLDERMETDSQLMKALYFLPDNAQHREMLRLGRLMGYFYDAFEIQQRLKDPLFSKDYKGLALHHFRIEESCTGAYIGISKKIDPDVYHSLIAAFESMKKDGSFDSMHRKWLGTEPDF